MTSLRKTLIGASCSILLISSAAHADWTLNNDESSFYYVTSKAGAISEINTFHGLTGTIADNGRATLDVSLASVDTMIELRDERVRNTLFKLSEFLPETAAAAVAVTVDARALNAMKAGETMQGTYETNVSILDVTQTVSADLAVTRLRGGGLLIHNVKPLIINAQAFGLSDGVEELRKIANLPSINNNVVVDFSLRFEPDD